jgi:hypothetical protein
MSELRACPHQSTGARVGCIHMAMYMRLRYTWVVQDVLRYLACSGQQPELVMSVGWSLEGARGGVRGPWPGWCAFPRGGRLAGKLRVRGRCRVPRWVCSDARRSGTLTTDGRTTRMNKKPRSVASDSSWGPVRVSVLGGSHHCLLMRLWVGTFLPSFLPSLPCYTGSVKMA